MANSKKNYNKISTEKATEETVDVVETVETTEVVEEAKNEPNTAKGVVANCSRLNVRKDPKKNGDIIGILAAKTKVVIDLDASTKTWYKLFGADTGYVMKDYITLAD